MVSVSSVNVKDLNASLHVIRLNTGWKELQENDDTLQHGGSTGIEIDSGSNGSRGVVVVVGVVTVPLTRMTQIAQARKLESSGSVRFC